MSQLNKLDNYEVASAADVLLRAESIKQNPDLLQAAHAEIQSRIANMVTIEKNTQQKQIIKVTGKKPVVINPVTNDLGRLKK